MQEEFKSSSAICDEILSSKENWDKLFETPNFFKKYLHFIVLEASSECEGDQLKWVGLIESKVRQLVANLETEEVNLAHIWPKTYSSLEDGKEKICCYWFIGLKLDMEGGKGGQLDLTTPIKVCALSISMDIWFLMLTFLPSLIGLFFWLSNVQAFTDIVMRSAIQINVWKTGMKILADYKRRKDLKQYLPHSEHWKLKNDRKSLNK